MQIVLIGNRVVAHGEDCFLSMGGTVICEETGKAYSNATVAEVDAIPADLDTVGYEYRAGVFAPCAPYGVGAGALMVACEECGTPKRSKVTADADGSLNVPGYLKGGKIGDEVSAALGLSNATVDEALRLLSRFNAGLGNEYVWEKRKTIQGDVMVQSSDTTRVRVFNLSSNQNVTVYKKANLINGQIVLSDSLEVAYYNAKGYYAYPMTPNVDTSKAYLLGDRVTYSNSSGSYYADYFCYTLSVVTGDVEVVDYINAPDPHAYSDGVFDGWAYTALGKIAALGARIETGSYTGTGTYGSGTNANTLSFGFEPKLVLVQSADNGTSNSGAHTAWAWVRGVGKALTYKVYSSDNQIVRREVTIEWSDNGVTWYAPTNVSTSNADVQLNKSNIMYYYLAIG